MASLFDIATEFHALNDLSNDIVYDEETGEILDESQTIKELFDGVALQLGDKLDNTMAVIKQMEASAKMLDEEAKRLSKRKVTLNNRIALLRELMLSALQASGEKKLKTVKFNYSLRNSESVNVKNVDELPREYVRLKREADKTKIKSHLKEGVIIEGCSIEKKQTLGVK